MVTNDENQNKISSSVDPEALRNYHEKLQKLSHDIAKFISLQEHTRDEFDGKIIAVENLLGNIEEQISEEKEAIKSLLEEIEEVMTVAGAARWRNAAEEALKLGHSRMSHLQELIVDFQQSSEKNLLRLEHVAKETEKRISRFLGRISGEQDKIVDDFQQRLEPIYKTLDMTVQTTLKLLKNLQITLLWKAFAIIISTSIITAFLTSSFLNAEWPWESFHESYLQRTIGKKILENQVNTYNNKPYEKH